MGMNCAPRLNFAPRDTVASLNIYLPSLLEKSISASGFVSPGVLANTTAGARAGATPPPAGTAGPPPSAAGAEAVGPPPTAAGAVSPAGVDISPLLGVVARLTLEVCL